MNLDCERGASCGVFLQNLGRRLSGHELSEASAVFAISLSRVSSCVDLSYFYFIFVFDSEGCTVVLRGISAECSITWDDDSC
jgi:hypothetical protein